MSIFVFQSSFSSFGPCQISFEICLEVSTAAAYLCGGECCKCDSVKGYYKQGEQESPPSHQDRHKGGNGDYMTSVGQQQLLGSNTKQARARAARARFAI